MIYVVWMGTRYHKLGSLSNKHLSVLETESPKSRLSKYGDASLAGLQQPPSVFSYGEEFPGISSYKDTTPIRSGPQPFNLISL